MAQTKGTYQKEVYVSKGDTLPYRLLVPKQFDVNKSYPLLIFLHGSGERGSDNEAQLIHGSDLFLKEEVREQYPAIVVFPQCPSGKSWNNSSYEYSTSERSYYFPPTIEKNKTLDLLEGLLSALQTNYRIDPHKIYLGGLSMGGMGTFEMLRRNPNLFAAAFAICGGANPAISETIKSVPIWIFHGEQDDVVPVIYSKEMHDAIQEEGGNSRITLYPEIKHDSWVNAFSEPELLKWLFSKSL
ncbi:MAG: dienelactone hydrolase family protein [Aureisphaera sp.]